VNQTAPVLVTGSTGLIGSAVVRELRSAGHAVVTVGRSLDCDVEADLSDRRFDALLGSVGEVAAIVHCAAVFPQVDEGAEAEACRRQNAAIDKTVGHLARDRDCRVVFCSSVAVYGGHGDDALLEESSSAAPRGPYACGKLESEHLFATDGGKNVSLRITSPYGRSTGRRTVLTIFADNARQGLPIRYFGAGSRTQDFVHADDVARACKAVIDRPAASGPFNVGSGRPISMIDLALLVQSLTTRGSEIEPSGGPDPLEAGRANVSIRRAQSVLGWAPRVDLKTGIERLLAGTTAGESP